MINDFVKCDKLVYLNDSNNEELTVRDYNNNIKEELKNENLIELIQNEIYNHKVNLSTIKQQYKESKESLKSYALAVPILLVLTAFIDIILFSGKDILGVLLGIGFSSISLITLIAIYLKNPFLSKAKKIRKISENLNTKIEYLNKELAKAKFKQGKSNSKCLDINQNENYKYSLKPFNEEQKALLKCKLALIDRYLANKQVYKENYEKGKLASIIKNPEEEQLIRELIKKEQ